MWNWLPENKLQGAANIICGTIHVSIVSCWIVVHPFIFTNLILGYEFVLTPLNLPIIFPNFVGILTRSSPGFISTCFHEFMSRNITQIQLNLFMNLIFSLTLTYLVNESKLTN
jgi:hypothetical protein